MGSSTPNIIRKRRSSRLFSSSISHSASAGSHSPMGLMTGPSSNGPVHCCMGRIAEWVRTYTVPFRSCLGCIAEGGSGRSHKGTILPMLGSTISSNLTLWRPDSSAELVMHALIYASRTVPEWDCTSYIFTELMLECCCITKQGIRNSEYPFLRPAILDFTPHPSETYGPNI